MNSLLAIYRFELKRIFRPGRSFWWVVTAAFPVVIIALMTASIQLSPDAPPGTREAIFKVALYYLAPSVACMLGALLTSAPAVANELEEHSWIYLATRPNGLFYLIMGKFLVSVTWSCSAICIGSTIACFLSPFEDPAQSALIFAFVILMASMAYAALYMMLGTIFHARSMVFCVGYTAAVEMFLGMFPAVVNRMTVQFRLRSLLYHMIDVPQEFRDAERVVEIVASKESAFLQVFWLVALTAVFLSVALVTVQVREFTAAQESEL